MSRPALRRITTGLLAGLALVAGAVSVAPAAAAADLPRPTVSHTSVQANEYFTVSGSGCVAGPGGTAPWVTITSPDTPEMGDGMLVLPDGTWSFRETFSAGHPQGTFRLQVTCDDYVTQSKYPLVAVTLGTVPVPAECASGCQTVAPGTTLTPDDKGVAPGEKRMLRLSGYLPNEVVTLVLHSTPQNLGTFTADSSGTITVAFTVPAGTPAGAHNLVVTRADGTTVTYPVTVAKAGPRLASTGADVTVPLVLGGGLVLAGAGALVVARRRSQGAAQA
ncbi:LPXTG cell wall anchor domain-containing protein [Blastococcus litoris]|uniref:LPXTG cell wall anchor domain-containing protein n=1 Tax=Blastococcus litoris TaxID=2171622 RepID=UPI000E301B25|nr:LPXTG cell wall anchor domain-containing protein [Blastococcus litoris]